jgi:hypothetical protein
MDYIQLTIKVSKEGVKPAKAKNFAAPPLNSTNHKIYIVRQKGRFLYVGQTKQTIGTKFGQSFRSYKIYITQGKKEGGYGGYKWIADYMNQELLLDVIDLGDDMTKIQAEAIEAEIAFAIRTKTKAWPLCQNEIHFNNLYADAVAEAEHILELINA